MGDANTNGDVPQSVTLNHISSYPAVNDGISYFKSNPYGAKSIDVTNAGYAKFVKPALPYFQTPASYAKPYAAKADEMGDKFLTKVDERIPIIKSETNEIKKTISDYVFWPLVKTAESRDYVYGVYEKEYKKCGGDGYVAGGKAVLTTPLVVSSEVLRWLSTLLQEKKEQAQEVVAEKTSN